MATDDHILAKKVACQRRYFEAAKECVKEKVQPVLEAQIRTATYLAERNIADRQFLGLVDLQISNGSSVLTEGNRSLILTNHQAPQVMQEYSAQVLKEISITRIKNSPFIGIMVDESLDISTNKKLVMFCKIINQGKVRIELAANITIQDGKAETVYNSIVTWLREIGYDIKRVSGFGSDGASVMMGKVNGVGVKLQSQNPRIVHMWCAAHRLALVSYWATKPIPYMQSINEILIAIFNFYNYSAARYNKIKELTAIMGEKVKRFKKPTQVRWLSMSDAVSTVFECYSVLVLSLEHEVATNPNSEGILKVIKSIIFLLALALLKDVLSHLNMVSKAFQRDVLDIHKLKTLIMSTVTLMTVNTETVQLVMEQTDEYSEWQGVPINCILRDRRVHGELRKTFMSNLLKEFEQRFPDKSLGVLNDLNTILNPKLLPEGVVHIPK